MRIIKIENITRIRSCYVMSRLSEKGKLVVIKAFETFI